MSNATILAGNTTSSTVDLTIYGDIGRERASGLLIPSNWVSGTISFLESQDMGATYQPIVTSTGTLYSETANAGANGTYIPLDLGVFGSITNFRIVSSVVQTSTVAIVVNLSRGDAPGLSGSSTSGTGGGAASTVTIAAGTAQIGYVIGEGVYNTAPTAVTSGAAVPFATDSIGRLLSTTGPQFGSGTATTAAAALSASSALANGLTLKANPNNTGTVLVYNSSTITTATGFPLLSGDAVPLAASNASQIFIQGNGTDTVNWAGN